MTRKYKYFLCEKRDCLKVNNDYESFGVKTWRGEQKTYCLNHIPLMVRIKMRVREMMFAPL
jgi:hypothetical protein